MTEDTNMKALSYDFEQILKHYLVNCNSVKNKIQNQKQLPELEVRFGTNSKYAKPISIIDYQNVVTNLLENNWTSTTNDMKGHQMLRVIPERLNLDMRNIPKTTTPDEPLPDGSQPLKSQQGGEKRKQFIMSNIRAELDGINTIQDYCVHNDLEKLFNKYNVVRFTKKKPSYQSRNWETFRNGRLY